MKNSPNQLNQLITTNKIKVPLGEQICKIDQNPKKYGYARVSSKSQ